jgi:subtilisin family serine protease
MATRKSSIRKSSAGRSTARPSAERSGKGRAAARGPGKKSGTAEQAVVVYIHGIGRHAPRDALKLEWDLALFGRDLGARSRMAYWADLLHGDDDAGAGTIGTRAGGAAAGFRAQGTAIDLDAVLRHAGVRPDNDHAMAFANAMARRLGATDAAGGGVGKRVLPLPAFLRKPIARVFLNAFVGDTSAYFFKPEMRRRIRARLRDELPADGAPVTIVAHSQGSIVAYEVLAALARDAAEVIELVTIGSPLGVQEVQDLLEPAGLQVPAVVKQWHNFADPLDPVALDKGLTSDFDPSHFIVDDVIRNDRTRQIIGFNPHSAVGYLAHPAVRKVVHAALRIDTMQRFVLSRDVAERLGTAPDERHPVLIEVLEPGYGAVGESPDETAAVEQREAVETAGGDAESAKTLLLAERIARATLHLRRLVADPVAARIDPLRRFVAAHLTPDELRTVAAAHRELRVYAVWRSSRKSKLTARSASVLKADAALASFDAGGRGITWAVLDTGVRADHPHFADGVIRQVWDCTRPGPVVPLVNARDPDGHGTHVSGIIAGRAPAAAHRRERGMAPLAKLVVYKVLDDKGSGEDAWIIKALDHIAAQNENHSGGLAIHGINLSLGGPFDSTVYGCGFSPICAELRRLWRAGVLVVVASGNEGQLDVQVADGDYQLNTAMSIGDPANLEECIAVGSINADQPHLYGVSSFSSRGPTADGRAKPDVVAPGERISSCNSRFRKDGSELYYAESGTSMAAPHVSGLLAAFLSVRREYRGRPDEVKRLLLDTCTDIGRDRYHQGRGIPNLMQMLLSV